MLKRHAEVAVLPPPKWPKIARNRTTRRQKQPKFDQIRAERVCCRPMLGEIRPSSAAAGPEPGANFGTPGFGPSSKFDGVQPQSASHHRPITCQLARIRPMFGADLGRSGGAAGWCHTHATTLTVPANAARVCDQAQRAQTIVAPSWQQLAAAIRARRGMYTAGRRLVLKHSNNPPMCGVQGPTCKEILLPSGQTHLSRNTRRTMPDNPRVARRPQFAHNARQAARSAFCTHMAVLLFKDTTCWRTDIFRPADQLMGLSP